MNAQSLQSWLGRGALLLLAVGCTLLAAEAILRSVETNRRYFVHKPGLRRIFRPMADVMPGVQGESRFFVNADGLRAPPLTPGQDLRILCVGGSTTECMILDEDRTWPALLNARLNAEAGAKRSIWVGNAGKSGCNSRHNLLHVEKLLKQLPRVDVLVLLLGVNDLGFRLAADRNYSPWQPEQRDADDALYEKAFAVAPARRPPGPRPALWALSSLRATFLRLRKAKEPAPELQAQVQDAAGACYKSWRFSRQKAGRIRNDLPDLGPALAEYEQNLRAILAAARQHRVRCVFLTQPVLWRAGLPHEQERLLWMGGVGNFRFEKGCDYYSTPALRAGMDLYNNTLREVCRAETVDCIDLAALLSKDLSLFYDDCHFNQQGAEQVAETLAGVMNRALSSGSR